MQCDEQQVHLQSYNITLRITNEELEEKKWVIKRLKEKINLTKEQPLYNEISKPELSIKQIEASMKLTDKFTLNQIIHYLKLDTFEIVKSIAGIVNKDNVSEVIAYRDWALQRNESLIKFLEKFAVEKTKFDKLKWE